MRQRLYNDGTGGSYLESPPRLTLPQGGMRCASEALCDCFSGAAGSLLLTLDTPNPQAGAWFGNAVAVGDVNGDGKADIGVGTPNESVGTNTQQGRTYVFSGADGSLLLTLDTPNPQASAYFGNAVAVGDVNGAGKADIAVGTPAEGGGTNIQQGHTYIFSGSGTASGASVSGGRGSSAPSAAVLAGIAAGGALLLLAAGGWCAGGRRLGLG